MRLLGRPEQWELENRMKITSPVFSADSKYFAYVITGNRGDVSMVWNVARWECVMTLECHTLQVVEWTTFSPDRKYLAMALALTSWVRLGTTEIYDIAQKKRIRKFKSRIRPGIKHMIAPNSSICSLAFSLDSQYLAVGVDGGMIEIWNIPSEECILTLEDRSDSISSVAFSAHTKYSISGRTQWNHQNLGFCSVMCLQAIQAGRFMDSISFDLDTCSLFTDIGRLKLDLPSDNASKVGLQSLEPQDPMWCGYGLNLDKNCITYDDKNVPWLPPEYRLTCSAVFGSTVAIGCASGRVLIFRFGGPPWMDAENSTL